MAPNKSAKHHSLPGRTAGLLLLLLLGNSGSVYGQAAPPTDATTGAAGGTGGAGASTQPQPQPQQASLPAFTAVRACLPFSILILPPPQQPQGAAGATPPTAAEGTPPTPPAPGPAPPEAAAAPPTPETEGANATSTTTMGTGNATIYITADPAVANATDIYVTPSGVLSLGVLNGFRSSNPINVTIVAADPSSLAYVQNFGSGDVVVGPGFNVANFSADATGLGRVLAYNLTAGRVAVTNTGTSTVLLNGTFADARIIAGGTSRVYLAGSSNGTIDVRADGISTVWVQATDAAQLTGSADALAKILYTAGTCNVRSSFLSLFGIGSIFGDPCQRVGAGTGPSITPEWTCGIYVDGSASCRGVEEVGGGTQVTLGPGAQAGAGAAGAGGAGTPPPPAAATPAPPGITTSQVPGGQVTTGTFTTPGGFSSASGTVSGGGPTLTQTQTAQGGQPANVQVSTSGVSQPAGDNTGIDLGLGIPEISASGLAVVSTRCNAQGPLPILP